jgi:hypothetical protein
MYEYDRAIDAVWVENALVEGAREEERAIANEKVAAAEEKAAAAEAAVAAERAKAAEAKHATAHALKAAGVSAEVIAQSTGLAAAEIARL